MKHGLKIAKPRVFLVLAAGVVTLLTAEAGPGVIGWRARAVGTDGSVETRGTLVSAAAGSACSVGGVRFAAMTDETAFADGLAVDRAVNHTTKAFVTDEAAAKLGPGVRPLLDGGLWLDSKARLPYALTIRNLTVGRRYLVQLWFADTREKGLAQAVSVDGAAMLDYRSAVAPRGMTAVGEFVADAETRFVRLVPRGASFQLNAVQVRALDAAVVGDGRNAPSRAAWMSGKYGLMVHWLFARYTGDPASVNGSVDGFDVGAFLKDFDETGAEWLFFTIGQNTGAYASPNSVIDRLCGPGHCSTRDLVAEIAAGVKARGRRFVAYLPVDCLVPSVQRGMGWSTNDLTRYAFQTNWAAVIREWAVRLGPNLDGWWFDGAGLGRHPFGFNEGLWTAAARAGNPDCALAYSQTLTAWKRNSAGEEALAGVAPVTNGDDYLGGEFNLLRGGRIWTGFFGVRPDSTWMPSTGTVPGTRCQVQALFCLDGFWPCWAAWPASWAKFAPFAKRLPGHFSQSAMNELRSRGEFPEPFLEFDEFRKFMTDYLRVGGGVTVNVGVTPEGRLNTKSLAYMRKLAKRQGDGEVGR